MQKCSTAQPSSSVAKHKPPRDTKKTNKTTCYYDVVIQLLTKLDAGETEIMLKDRIQNHLSDIKKIWQAGFNTF